MKDRAKKIKIKPESDAVAENETAVADSDSNDVDSLRSETAADTGESSDQVALLKQQLEEAEKNALRVQADIDNFRKRTRRDTQDQIRYATLPLMTEIIDVIDNLQRAIESAESSDSTEGLLAGVKMVEQHLTDILAKQGCEKIETVGKPFDPNHHEAVQMQPSDEIEANHVTMELRKGYKLHDRVVRPAQVFVSKGPADNISNE